MKLALSLPSKLVKSDYQLLVFKQRPPVEELIKANKNENAYPITYLFCIKDKGSSAAPSQKSYKQVMRVEWPAILLADEPGPSIASLGAFSYPVSLDLFNEYFFDSSYPRVEFLVDSLRREAHQIYTMESGELLNFTKLSALMVFVASYDIKNSTPAEKFSYHHKNFIHLHCDDPELFELYASDNAVTLKPHVAHRYDKWRDALSQDFVALCREYLKNNLRTSGA